MWSQRGVIGRQLAHHELGISTMKSVDICREKLLQTPDSEPRPGSDGTDLSTGCILEVVNQNPKDGSPTTRQGGMAPLRPLSTAP